MNLEIDDIKALEPGKIYCLSVDSSKSYMPEAVACLLKNAKKYDLKFIIIDSEDMKLISVPEGLEVNKK